MTTILEEIKRRIQVWNEKHAERIEAARQAALQCNATVVLPARLRWARREL